MRRAPIASVSFPYLLTWSSQGHITVFTATRSSRTTRTTGPRSDRLALPNRSSPERHQASTVRNHVHTPATTTSNDNQKRQPATTISNDNAVDMYAPERPQA